MAKWLDFTEMQTSTKTKVFYVWNKEKETLIGEVRWYGPWRQYAFMPAQNTVWERQCLMKIARQYFKSVVEDIEVKQTEIANKRSLRVEDRIKKLKASMKKPAEKKEPETKVPATKKGKGLKALLKDA